MIRWSSAGSIAASALPQSVRAQIMCLRGCRSLRPHTVTLTVQHQLHKMHDGGSNLILNILPHALNTIIYIVISMHNYVFANCSVTGFDFLRLSYFKQFSSLCTCAKKEIEYIDSSTSVCMPQQQSNRHDCSLGVHHIVNMHCI